MAFLTSLTRATTRAELVADGITDHEIRRAVSGGTLTALAPGVVIRTDLLDGTPEQRHRELARAWWRRQRSSEPRRALAAVSAAAALGLPVWGLDTTRVVVTEFAARSRSRTSGLTQLISDGRAPSTMVHDGVLVVTPARVVVDIARTADRIAAVVVGDAALRMGLCSLDELAVELSLIHGMVGAAQARRVIELLDGKSESVLESRSRMVFLDAGLPAPELQVELYDQWGNLVARVDFYWREKRVVGESNGLAKYSGDDGIGRVLYEKQRSDALTELGNRVVPWGWKDLEDPKLQKNLIERLTAWLA